MKLQLGFTGERYLYLSLHIIEQAKCHPMTQGLYVKYLGHFVNAKHHYINRLHGCKDHILLYCREGKGWVEIDGKMYNIEKNTFIIIPPNIPHSYGANELSPWSIYWLHFQGNYTESFSEIYNMPFELHPSSISRIEERIELFEEMFQTLSINQGFDYFCYANSCFIHFLSTLRYVNIYKEVNKQKNNIQNFGNKQLINRLTHYMSENIDNKFTIKDLCQFMNLSPSYLHRIFIKYYGISPMSYLIKMKINRACDMLMTTSMRVNQISTKLGYDDPLYFSRQFKNIIGVSPKRFKELNSI